MAAALGGLFAACIGGGLSGSSGVDASAAPADAWGDGSAGDAGDLPDSVPAPDVVPAGGCARVGEWSSTATFADSEHVSHPLPSFAVGSFYARLARAQPCP